MYVPDPGLMAKVDDLLKDSGEDYMDTQVYCREGSFSWSSLLLIASSDFLKMAFSLQESESESSLILPDFQMQFVHQVFCKLFEFGNLEFNQEEIEFLILLGVHSKIAGAKKRKTVQILSSSSSKSVYRRDEQSHERSIISLNQGDENDVDIIFENMSDAESEKETGEASESHEQQMEQMEVQEAEGDMENMDNRDNDDGEEENGDIAMDDQVEGEERVDEQGAANVDDECCLEPGFKEKSKDEEKEEKARKTSASKKRYSCKQCKEMFDFWTFKKHLKEFPTHFAKKYRVDLFCRLCNLDFKAEGMPGFKAHVASHKNADKMFPCPKCDKISDTWGHLNQHMYKHGGERPYRCSYCDYDSINRSNIVKHEKTKHENPDKRDFVCDICFKKFKIVGHLTAHKKTHEDTKLVCDICLKVFKTDVGLHQHKRIHTGNTIPCQVCKEIFLTNQSVKRHEKEIHSYHRDVQGDRKFICKTADCNAAFQTLKEKETHSKKYHDNENLFNCDGCSSTFSSHKLLRTHKNEQCPKAGLLRRRRNGKSLLRPEDKTEMFLVPVTIKNNHPKGSSILRSEGENQEFKCDCCSQKFKYEYLLLAHQIIKENKGLRCNIDGCSQRNKPFLQEAELLAHMLRHTAESVYKCSYCDKGFSRENLLKKHESTHNVALVNFTCPYQNCGVVFFNFTAFDEHMVLHYPEHNSTSFTCYVCSKEFDSKESKEEHTSAEHPAVITSFTCTHCGERQPSILVHKMHEKYCKNNKAVESKPTYKCSFCQEIMSSVSGKLLHEKHCRKNVELLRELTVETVETVEESPVEIYSTQHDDINRYFYDICKICKKIFVNFTEYVDHFKLEHSAETTVSEVDCNICGKTVSIAQLDNHLSLYHSLGSIFKCEDCNRSFKNVETLEQHNDEFHDQFVGFCWDSRQSRFMCNFCTKGFKTKTGVSKHLTSTHADQYARVNQEIQIVLDDNPMVEGEEEGILQEKENIIWESQLLDNTSQYLDKPIEVIQQTELMVDEENKLMNTELTSSELVTEDSLVTEESPLVDMLDVVVTEDEFTNNVVIQVERNEENGNIVATLLPP